jgi:hypothetical protein
MFGLTLPAWLTGKLAAGLGGALLILLVLGGLYGSGRHAGKLAQERHDAPIIAKLQAEVAEWTAYATRLGETIRQQNASLQALRDAQAAKVEAADKAIQPAIRRRPHVEAKVRKLAGHVEHPELSGATLEAWTKADEDVVEALR